MIFIHFLNPFVLAAAAAAAAPYWRPTLRSFTVQSARSDDCVTESFLPNYLTSVRAAVPVFPSHRKAATYRLWTAGNKDTIETRPILCGCREVYVCGCVCVCFCHTVHITFSSRRCTIEQQLCPCNLLDC